MVALGNGLEFNGLKCRRQHTTVYTLEVSQAYLEDHTLLLKISHQSFDQPCILGPSHSLKISTKL